MTGSIFPATIVDFCDKKLRQSKRQLMRELRVFFPSFLSNQFKMASAPPYWIYRPLKGNINYKLLQRKSRIKNCFKVDLFIRFKITIEKKIQTKVGEYFNIVYQWQSTVSLIALSPDLSPFCSIGFLFDIGLVFLVFSLLCPRANQRKVRRKAWRKSSFRK